jgi:hypothetical protein
VAPSFADSGMGADRLEPLVVAQVGGREVGGRDKLVEIAIGASVNERRSPFTVREAFVQPLLGLGIGQGVELGYAANDETLTFQLDG